MNHTFIVVWEYGILVVHGTGGLRIIVRTGQTITVDADNSVVILEDLPI